MAQPLSVPPSGFDELPVVLEKRLEAMKADGHSGRAWSEVRKDLHARLRAVRK